jgi:hypothetical protein
VLQLSPLGPFLLDFSRHVSGTEERLADLSMETAMTHGQENAGSHHHGCHDEGSGNCGGRSRKENGKWPWRKFHDLLMIPNLHKAQANTTPNGHSTRHKMSTLVLVRGVYGPRRALRICNCGGSGEPAAQRHS